MASIKKRPGVRGGDGVWQAQFYVTDPESGKLKQVRKSTGETTKKKAQAKANEFETAAKGIVGAGSDRAQKVRGIYAEVVMDIESDRFNAVLAQQYLSRILGVATGEEMKTYTVETWSEEWLHRKARPGSNDTTMARYRGHSAAFLSWLGPDRSKKTLGHITGQDVRLWREHLASEGLSGKTTLGYIKDLGAIFRAAIDEGVATLNPCRAIIPEIDTCDSQERKPFTLEEVANLLAAAATLSNSRPKQIRTPEEQAEAEATAAEWCGLILAAAFTGLRLEDTARLKWESVCLETEKITLIPSKTRKKKREVKIPIQSDLMAFLRSALIKRGDIYIFPRLAKMRVGSSNGLSATFVKIMAAAKVDRGKPSRVIKEGESKGKGRITYERGFHSLRHTFTSWLRNAGVSEEDRMALTGHSTRESHQIYSHAKEAVLRLAVAKLPLIKDRDQRIVGDTI